MSKDKRHLNKQKPPDLRNAVRAHIPGSLGISIPPRKMVEIPNPADGWAQVELFRWQYGCLPEPTDRRPLSVPAALRGMADAIEKKDKDNFPNPFNVMIVLRYAAKELEKK